MKLLLLGADGQVGHALRHSLTGLGDITVATRSGRLPGGLNCAAVDFTNAQQLSELIHQQRPDWIVNAAAYTAVDRAEDEQALACRINAGAVADIGKAANSIGARVLHYSTDYVFPGDGDVAWREEDPTGPLGVYGCSKRDGEQALRDSGAAHLIVRTAWVYGTRGNNFLRTMLRLAAERTQLNVVADQFGTPTTANLIAQISALMIARMGASARTDARHGTYHLTASAHTSWHGFAVALLDAAQHAGLIAQAPEVRAISSSEYPTRAQRPKWSVLDNRKLQTAFDVFLPHWQNGLDSTISALADEQTRWPNP